MKNGEERKKKGKKMKWFILEAWDVRCFFYTAVFSIYSNETVVMKRDRSIASLPSSTIASFGTEVFLPSV